MTRELDAKTVADAAARAPKRIAFFHQNDVFSRQGGIERYVATLVDHAKDDAVLISPLLQRGVAHHFAIFEKGPKGAPQWLRFLLGMLSQRRALVDFLEQKRVRVLEFSRPEHVFAAWLMRGKKVFTIHGTGPDAGNRLHYLVHHACCLSLPFVAARVQVIGRDPSGLPAIARALLGDRVVHVDGWSDARFTPRPLPPIERDGPLRAFYAGRIAPQKNPELLFSIIREAARIAPGALEFHYFGSDYEELLRAGLGDLVQDHGFLSPPALAEAMSACHVGILCSAYGEGSPFIVVEALACGRPFVLPPLPTLVASYGRVKDAHIVTRYDARDFLEALLEIRREIIEGRIDPHAVAAQVAARSVSKAAPRLLEALARLDPPLRRSTR